MSGTVSTLSSTKGDLSATNNPAPQKQATKTGFDHLDVNRLFKGKTAEPTTKLVAQKHGMQTLGKVLPARRAGGGPTLTGTTVTEGIADSGEGEKASPGQDPAIQDSNQGWTNQQTPPPQQLHPQQPPPHHPNQIQPLLVSDLKWNGGRVDTNYPGSRFAQEFPSLDATVADTGKGQGTGGGHPNRQQTKSQDNQYGPGPILRPQTEGSWTQGGSGGQGQRPPPNQQPHYPPDRSQMNSMPGSMPIGQIPPPLGAYQPTFRPNQPNVPYGKGGGGGFYPGGQNPALRFGMPIPPEAPPPGHGGEAPPPLRRGPPPRPTSHFTKPIIRQEELERMDEIGTHEGDWASTNDDVDYNKKINFSDDEDHPPRTSRSSPPQQLNQAGPKPGTERQQQQQPPPRFTRRGDDDRDRGPRPQPQIRDRDSDEDWRPRRGDKEREVEHAQRSRDDDWRSGPSRPYVDDYSSKKPILSQGQRDSRQPQDFSNSNVPPRFLRRFNQAQTQPAAAGQRDSPSPVATNGAKDSPPPPYKILERKRGESESSRDSKDSKEKRPIPVEREREPTRTLEREVKDEFRRKEVTSSAPPVSTTVSKAPEPERVEKRITSSWAEEMDEDESLNAISEIRKPHLKEVTPVLRKEERRDRIESKRIIKQTKVADMQTIVKEESPATKLSPGKKETAVSKSPVVPNVEKESPETLAEVVKPKPASAWGDIEKNNVGKTEKPKAEPVPVAEPLQKKETEKKDSVPEKKAPSEERVEKKEPVTTGPEKEVTKEKQEQDEKRGKAPPQRKNSRESKHPPPKQESTESIKDEGKKTQKQVTQPPAQLTKSHENVYHKDQHQRESSDGKKEDKRGPPPNKQQHKGQGQTEGKHAPPVKVEETRKGSISDEGKRQGTGWDKQPRRGGGPARHSSKDEDEKGTVPKSEVSKKNEVEAGSDNFRRGNKSPSGSKRNPTPHGQSARGGGASRLQGYGPPSDRSPFSANTNKEPEEERKEKEKKDPPNHSTRIVIPPPTSGPVPLMALGEISPPDLPLRNRHHDYSRAPAPRFQRSYASSQRDRPHKQSQPNNSRGGGGKGGGNGRKGETDSEQESSRWSAKPNTKQSQNEDTSKRTGTGSTTESEPGKDIITTQSPPTSTIVPPTTAPPLPEPVVELGKVPTMVFENTKLKMTDPQQLQQNNQVGKSLPPLMQHTQQSIKTEERKSFSPGMGQDKGALEQSSLDLSNNQGLLPFPKEPSPVKLDFGPGFGEERDKGTLYQQSTRSYGHVQEEYRSGRRISPLQTDLPESLQGLRSLWETPQLPHDGTQNTSPLTFGQEPETGLHYGSRGQGGDKQSESQTYHLAQMQRSLGNMGQQSQGTNGYQSTQVPPVSVSVIAKPVSCGSPNGLNRQQHAQMKSLQQQQLTLESQQQQQTHGPGPMTFSPFGYGANAFGPIGGVPSPPSMYSQKSTQLYQQFNHHDNAHVISGGARTHSQYGNYTNVGSGAGGNPYGSSLYLQPFENFGHYATHSGPPQPPPSLQLQSGNRISPGPGIIPPTSASGHALPSPGMMNSTSAPTGNNAFKTVQVRNPNSHQHPSLLHQNNQQPFSQLTHHLPPHPHLTPIGPQKTPYSQQPLQPQTQPQLYIPFDANPQSLMSLGGNYGPLRSGGAPPPSATPPMQGLSSYYPTGTGVSQGYPQQNPQGGSLQGMQVQQSNPHYGIQFQPQYSNSQVQGPAPSVLGNSLIRPQHGTRK